MLYKIHHHQQLANASLAASPQKKPALVRQLAGKDDLSSLYIDGGEVRGPASILPGSAAGGAGCGQLPETLETLGGGALLRDWEGGL